MAFHETLQENHRATRNVVLFTVLFIACLWGIVACWAVYHRRETVSTSEAALGQMTHAVEQYVQNTINIAAIFQMTAERWLEDNPARDPCSDPRFNALIEDFRRRTDGLIDIRLMTSAGDLFYFPCRAGVPLDNVADREYFRTVIDAPPGSLHVGIPVVGRVTGQWRLPITVRMRRAHYGLEVINASIDLGVMGAAFEAERPVPDGAISLWRQDGVLLARAPYVKNLIGEQGAPLSPSWESVVSAKSGVFEVGKSSVDGVDRFVAFKHFGRAPLIVAVSSTVDTTLAGWRRQVASAAALLFLITLWGTIFASKLVGALQKIEANSRDLHSLATHDATTGLFNRRHLMETGERELARMRRYGSPMALMMLDVDHFKRVNDTWGHPVGDRVLREVARVMRSVVRDQDTVGRMGGEEFAVVVPETDRAGALAVAERMRSAIEANPVQATDDGAPVRVTVSIGVTEVHAGDESFEVVILRTDRALYAAKEDGRNRVVAG